MEKKERNYVIRYGLLPANIICNLAEPGIKASTTWDERGLARRAKARENYIKSLNTKFGFYDKLEESMLADGLSNPIIVNAGYTPPKYESFLPPEMKADKNKILICYTNGGSRLMLAQKHNMHVPCIINDFCDYFPYLPTFETEKELMVLYGDMPEKVIITDHGVCVSNLPQTHLMDNKMTDSSNDFKLMEGEVKYTIRYGVFKANDIFNLLGPGVKYDTSPIGETAAIRQKRINIENDRVKRRNKLDGFYEKLEESILADGVRNPICTSTGRTRTPHMMPKLPLEWQKDPSKIWVCDFQGGSRLFIAQKHDLEIPCFIADFNKRFKDYEEIETNEQALSKFNDVPTEMRLYKWGIYFHKLPAVHMK